MRTTGALITAFAAFLATSALAQQTVNSSLVPSPYSELKTLAGYQPSVLSSEYEAKLAYDQMPTRVFKRNSECYQRAHNWAFDLKRRNGVDSMKVFLLFTSRYQREFDYHWDYHVAPLIPVRMNDGSIEELVFDPTFTSRPSTGSINPNRKYEEKPISLNEWIKHFVSPEVECPVIENYADYYNYQDRYYCYVMKAPMYNYIPDDFDNDQTGATGSLNPKDSFWFDKSTRVRKGWRVGDLDQMEKALATGNR